MELGPLKCRFQVSGTLEAPFIFIDNNYSHTQPTPPTPHPQDVGESIGRSKHFPFIARCS